MNSCTNAKLIMKPKFTVAAIMHYELRIMNLDSIFHTKSSENKPIGSHSGTYGR
jgi:hypothetical protein